MQRLSMHLCTCLSVTVLSDSRRTTTSVPALACSAVLVPYRHVTLGAHSASVPWRCPMA